MESSGPGFLFIGIILITASTLLVVIRLFRFSALVFLFSLGRLYVSRNLFVSSRLSSLLFVIIFAFNYSVTEVKIWENCKGESPQLVSTT